MKPAEIEEEVQRVAPMQNPPAGMRERPDAPMATPVKLTWAKQYAGLRAPLAPSSAAPGGSGSSTTCPISTA